jgi:hypothetical protein
MEIGNKIYEYNPVSSGPALQPVRFSREGVACYSSSNGMMEWWNNGILGIKLGNYPEEFFYFKSRLDNFYF